MSWKPIAPLKNIYTRTQLYQHVREFFAARNVLEVETPLLSKYTVTDPHIESFQLQDGYFLQTSPEYAMKRLIVAGSGPIFQISKAFRAEEAGRQHNPEFTLLEWYRPSFTHHDLMCEIDALLQFLLKTKPAEKITYQNLFLKHLNIDPFNTELDTLNQHMIKNNIDVNAADINFDTALQLLLAYCIEPKLGIENPLFLYDFPPSQAALAKIHNNRAARFELYINGMEIANGFHELTDANEQHKRFERDQEQRKILGKKIPAIDQRFIDALTYGLPDCAGVAMGLDRLLMLLLKTNHIQSTLAFDWSHA